jgi:hypothetical protein
MASRELIIEDIKRIAADNGGRAPGWQLFRTETGLSESSWRGRYWARWSDALIEAGFEANERSKAYADEELFDALIRVTRKYGHLPTSSEYKLVAREDDTLPGFSAIERLGSRTILLQKLADFLRGKPAFLDVAQFFAESPVKSHHTHSQTKQQAADDGFVYLIKSGRYYKIGRSNAAGRREREIALQLPEAVKTLHVIRTDDPVGIESYWHTRYIAKRKNGEWFDLNQADIAAFKRRKFM